MISHRPLKQPKGIFGIREEDSGSPFEINSNIASGTLGKPFFAIGGGGSKEKSGTLVGP